MGIKWISLIVIGLCFYSFKIFTKTSEDEGSNITLSDLLDGIQVVEDRQASHLEKNKKLKR